MLQAVKGSYDRRYSHRFQDCSHMPTAYFILPREMAQAVKLHTYSKGSVSSVSRNTGCPDSGFGSSPQSFRADAGIVPEIRLRPLPSE
jgi:hypothetical protein